VGDQVTAALLRRAAELLISCAADADGPAPWHTDGDIVIAADGDVIARTDRDRAGSLWEAEWIALMHPGIAQPIAAWLRDAADWRSEEDDTVDEYALVVARAVLGEDK
jgi:hypothetical protein